MVIEFMVVRSVFNFSKLVRYNILLIFSLLMLQSLIICYWDVLFHRQISANLIKWSYDQGVITYSDKELAFSLFILTFVVFLIGYFYLYITALRGKFSILPGLNWITDSVCFWLKIKTPTMRSGKRKRKKK
jgi:hypothetical protein